MEGVGEWVFWQSEERKGSGAHVPRSTVGQAAPHSSFLLAVSGFEYATLTFIGLTAATARVESSAILR